jgi:hypothetical protein
MIMFAVFVLSMAICLIINYGVIVFLDHYRGWGLGFDGQCFVVALSGAVPLFSAMVLADHGHLGPVLYGAAIVGIDLSLLGMGVLTCVACAALGRLAQRLGTRANQAQAEYTFHRDLDNQ